MRPNKSLVLTALNVIAQTASQSLGLETVLTVLSFHHDLVWARLTPAVSRYLLALHVPNRHGLGREAMALEPIRTTGVL